MTEDHDTDERALAETAEAMVHMGKGILAIDESVPTITKRFEALGITSTEESRRQYRQLLMGAENLAGSVSGAILHEETLGQSSDDGSTFPEFLAAQGILPGIKVDIGTRSLAGAPGEKITEGLDGLDKRVAAFRAAGARFAKWRAVFTIRDGQPSPWAMRSNADALARYAGVCQEGGLVPIVEPEVLMDGDHDLDTCFAATRRVLAEVCAHLVMANVDLRSMVLKPSMVIPGAGGPPASVSEVAGATVRCLLDTVPAAIPGVAFLSGGQAGEVATAHLDAIARLGPHPWCVTFSYGRALQNDPMRVWAGDQGNVAAAGDALLSRAKANSAAAQGRSEEVLEAST
ncbi:MAG: fructose-bisphosphate aldolase class I [Actinomycetota bacterium]|nr:fructose-bisphosphate aldolase class I [Actinomycetota bacterium]